MAVIAVERGYAKTRKAVLEGLIAFNRAQSGVTRSKRLAVSLKQGGTITGGVTGNVWMGVLFIELFWISAKHRGKGHGAAIIKALEDKARDAGAGLAYVDTFDFQAPGFYKKQGYRKFGELTGYPGGHTRYWLAKKL